METQNNTENNNKTKEEKYIHALKYGIAALSLVSFFTTSNGLSAIITSKGALTPYLISFGIQVVVLIVGTELVNIIKHIKELIFWKGIKALIAICTIIPYLGAVGFSSFFSYVFLANNAYAKVKESDYNIAIELFFNEEILKLRELNDATGAIILNYTQNLIPTLQASINSFQEKQQVEVEELQNNLVFFDKSEIPQSSLFSADEVINLYYISAQSIQTRLQRIEDNMKDYAESYAKFYSLYKNDFDIFKSLKTTNNLTMPLKQIIENMTNTLNSIERIRNNLLALEDPIPEYTDRIKYSASFMDSDFEGLSLAYKDLLSAYSALNENETISNGNINLKNIYNTIYSTIDISSDKISNAIEDLKEILSAMIANEEEPTKENKTISDLSLCITYLGEFQKYKSLSSKLDLFETEILAQVYVIDYNESTIKHKSDERDSEQNGSTDVKNTLNDAVLEDATTEFVNIKDLDTPTINEEIPTIENDTRTDNDLINVQVKTVTKNDWNTIRRINLGQFINLIKSLPNFEVILNSSDTDPDHLSSYVTLLKKNINYKTKSLQNAYALERQALEKISTVEQAKNFLCSEYKFMALYSSLIALFLDLTPLFVGVFIYFTDKKAKEKKDNKE